MKKSAQIKIIIGVSLLLVFVAWTILVSTIDVKSIGPLETSVGFATLNGWFHSLTGVHMWLYNITDILGVVPFLVAFIFATLGLVQLIKRKSFIKVDFDILMLGAHYISVMLCFLFFEVFVINYRPILIEGNLEASYPSSTSMLALSVMIPFAIQIGMRVKKKAVNSIVISIVFIFTFFMVIGRAISGVHWITDIIGGVFLSSGLIIIYSALYKFICKK